MMPSTTQRFDVYQPDGRRWYRLSLPDASEYAGIAPAGALRDVRCILRGEADALLSNARTDGLRVVALDK